MSQPVTFRHAAFGGNLANGGFNAAGDPGTDGFNLADVSSQSDADSLPTGVQGIVFIDGTAGATTAFQTAINAMASDGKIDGFFLGDGVTSAETANIKAAADYVHAHASGKYVFITADNSGTPDSPSYAATPSNTDADYVGLDAFPSETSGYDSNVIPNAVSAAESAGWSASSIIPVYQAFGGTGDWALPTSTQEGTILSQWYSAGITNPAFDTAANWTPSSGSGISSSTSLQSVFSSHNALTAPSTSLHYTPNGNFANGGYDSAGDPGPLGFNVADVSSQATADGLPSGDSGLLFLPITGDTSGFESVINATASDSKIWGYYLGDDATSGDEANIKAEVDYIHTNAPSKMNFIVADNTGSDTSPTAAFGPSAVDMTTSKDLVGVDPYPVQSGFTGGMNLDTINDRVTAWENAGWSDSQMVPIYQDFGNYGTGDWVLPTPAQEAAILQRWQSLLPNPTLDMAYSWGQQLSDDSLSASPALQQVSGYHNGVMSA